MYQRRATCLRVSLSEKSLFALPPLSSSQFSAHPLAQQKMNQSSYVLILVDSIINPLDAYVSSWDTGGTWFCSRNSSEELHRTLKFGHHPSTILDSVKLYHNISNPQIDMSCLLFHKIPLKPPSSTGLPTGENRVTLRLPTWEAAMPHPRAHHRGLWPFQTCSTAKLCSICILGKSKLHSNFAFDRFYDVFCVSYDSSVNADVRIFWEVKIYSIATLVILFCKCQMLQLNSPIDSID